MAKRSCKGCGIDISRKHPNAKFHSKKCKDKFHNWNNPRGKFAHLKDINEDYDYEHPFSTEALGQWE